LNANHQLISDELLQMAAEDIRVREELARSGELFEGYHPRMREVHERNAARLLELIESHGWPTRALVGEEGANAAWLILQHAIGNPSLQRRGLVLMKEAQPGGEVSRVHVAMLEDRIRVNEGRGQRYGTQFDWDSGGLLSPLPLEDADGVDRRRIEVGLPPLDEDIQRMRQMAARNGDRPPADWQARQSEIRDWRRSAGWLDED
jgi:hypothetical protein